jgi:hypothetical protein
MIQVSPQKRMIRAATDYPLTGEIVTNSGTQTIQLREIGNCYQDNRRRLFNKKSGKRPGDTMTGVFLKTETVGENK